jgi:hypothetical protein
MKILSGKSPAIGPLYDFLWAGSKPNARTLYAEAREQSPVRFEEKQNSWLVLCYGSAVACLRDVERLSNDQLAEFHPFVVGDAFEQTQFRKILPHEEENF